MSDLTLRREGALGARPLCFEPVSQPHTLCDGIFAKLQKRKKEIIKHMTVAAKKHNRSRSLVNIMLIKTDGA